MKFDEDSFVLGARTRLLRKEYRNLSVFRAVNGSFRILDFCRKHDWTICGKPNVAIAELWGSEKNRGYLRFTRGDAGRIRSEGWRV